MEKRKKLYYAFFQLIARAISFIMLAISSYPLAFIQGFSLVSFVQKENTYVSNHSSNLFQKYISVRYAL